ncbi:3-hydroxyisobutyrate dehydrogenase [Novosphingobium sp. CF614]|uniref:NAD(P)-dependent oxidoreductase n=1 Tax=Novosphingobium sp. CF614 TaxID=1884364 RepID=UPI0008F3A861|nr:NAD(P)-dependent oxidoreductase [Novosphingobium sp. CF614]SFG46015.1 3-hydroxyisobutyrate dehydrogenase [Novosphingobium sp. CF614]
MEQNVALIGFGEAGMTFAAAAGWKQGAAAYDIAPDRLTAAAQAGVVAARDARRALRAAPVVLSLVTADQALPAAREYAALIAPGALWCDMNSVAPETKRAAAAVVEAAGGRYVDVAVLAPVNPARLSVPLLLAGATADAARKALSDLGFTNLRVVGEAVGRASAIKMIRSVMVKGLEALTAETMLAAAAADVTEEVLASLDASERPMSWKERADYNLDRMLVHGLRRAAEMSESSETLRGLGVAPMMTRNTAGWQQALGELAIRPVPQGLDAKLAAIMRSPAFQGEN